MTCRPCGLPCFRRSNRHLHHRPDDARTSSVERYAGEQAISAPVTTTQPRFFTRSKTAPGRVHTLCEGRIPVRVSKAGFEPAFSIARSIRHLHHQRRFSRMTRQTGLKQISCAALGTAPLLRTPRGSLCHRYPACASFPPAGPALVGTRLPARAPGSGSPVPACAGMFFNELLRTTKNPPERLAREGPPRADCRSRLREIAPMSRAYVSK